MESRITKVLIGAALAIASGVAFAGPSPDEWRWISRPAPIEAKRIASDIVNATNTYRKTRGVAPLAASASLRRAAQEHADYLARTDTVDYLTDERPPIAAAGYGACVRAENLFAFQGRALNLGRLEEQALESWKSNVRDRAYLSSARVKHIGVGVAAWTDGYRHVVRIVQVLGGECSKQPLIAPPACAPGFEPRLAGPADRVCVTPDSRAQVSLENRSTALTVQPGGGAYGPQTCRSGLVWRMALAGDLVCVAPKRRYAVQEENRLAASRTR
jgi:uncharacterized protein YkwD